MQVSLLILCFSILVGCSQSTSLAQQYNGDTFSSNLNQVDSIYSNKPRDFSNFSKQAEQVISHSPSMATRYQGLYEQLNHWVIQSGEPAELANYGIEIAQLGGGDKKGNVLFTGYFSPVIELRHQADNRFKYPLYGLPECSDDCPTRSQIYDGALDGLGLELGFAENMIDPFIMEVQGSGFVHFADDNTLQYFGYAGKNNKEYVSIGRLLIESGQVKREDMSLKAIKNWVGQNDADKVQHLLQQNPSFVFFAPKQDLAVTGAAGIPLLPMASVAGDKNLFPMGTPILAEVPLLNADGTWSGAHALRLLIVLDTGGAVKQNHLDLYHGMGPRAGTEAGHYKHFGRVWKLGLTGEPTASPWLTSSDYQATSN
ncbi:murein transglycosylase A [Vibrio sp. MA40-2]|uniref:murein transglycosylase A n=1 Tax=Vibrio sp. MA40-2 TaxID=3391828 RepID=UPI0039A604CD